MAKLFADQGYLRKAAEIYRALIAREPQDAGLRQALADVEDQIAGQTAPARKETELMLREWIDLLKRCKSRNDIGPIDQRRKL